MENTRFSVLTILFMIFAFVPNTFAQGAPQLDLPEGAKARLSTKAHHSHGYSVSHLAFSPDGRILASDRTPYTSSTDSRTPPKIHLWDPGTGTLLDTLDLAALHPDCKFVEGMTFTPYRSTSNSQTLVVAVNGMEDVPGGGFYAGSGFGKIALWDVAARRIFRSMNTSDYFLDVNGDFAIYPGSKIATDSWDGRELLFGTRWTSKVWRHDVAFWEEGRVYLWDLVNGGPIHGIRGHTGDVRCVAADSKGFRLASGGSDGTVRCWGWSAPGGWKTQLGDVPNYIRTEHTNAVTCVAFSPDLLASRLRKKLASGSEDKTIRLWDVVNGDLIDTITANDMEEVVDIAFSPDGKMLASGDTRGVVYLWDVRIRPSRLIRTFDGHSGPVSSVAFRPVASGALDSMVFLLASGGLDGTVFLWEVPPAPPLPFLKEDVNADGIVNIQDLVLVAANLGKTGEHPADVNGDNVVNILDLTLVAKAMEWATPQAHHK